ncbi:MAG: hypothetical protein AAGG72_10545 [Pseudomonadota bacterium]
MATTSHSVPSSWTVLKAGPASVDVQLWGPGTRLQIAVQTTAPDSSTKGWLLMAQSVTPADAPVEIMGGQTLYGRAIWPSSVNVIVKEAA